MQFGTFRYQGAKFLLEPTDVQGSDAVHIIRRYHTESTEQKEYMDEGIKALSHVCTLENIHAYVVPRFGICPAYHVK